MKSLTESIIKSNDAGIHLLKETDTGHLHLYVNLSKFLDTYDMYRDAKAISGNRPDTHAEAFQTILCQPGSFIHQSDIKKLQNPSAYRNDIIDKILKEKFKKYLIEPNKFNFYFTEDPRWPSYYKIGIHKKGSLESADILDIKL